MNTTRRELIKISAGALAWLSAASAQTDDPLPSWNPGLTKQAILDFVSQTIDKTSSKFVEPEARIAVFDQDGTLWVEHPIYSEVLFAYDHVAALASRHPEWKRTPPFQAVLAKDEPAMEKFRLKDIETIVMANQTGMTTDDFQKIVNEWMQPPNIPDATGLIRRWSKPMLEVIRYLGDNGYRAYIVNWRQPGFRTGVSANGIWDSRPEDHRIGAADSIHLQRSGPRRPVTGKLLLNNNFSGKAEDIYIFLGKHPRERSAIRPATGRCWNIRSGRRRSSDAACLTTTPGASLPMVRRKVFPTQGSGRSRKPCVTRH